MGIPVTRTLAEIDATVRKAMRGHGCPWGMAEEAGKAARWLASHGLPADKVMAALTASRESCCCALNGEICALQQATGLADRADTITGPMTLTTAQPLLVLAQMGRAADALDRAFSIKWDAASACVAQNSLDIEAYGNLLAPASELICIPIATAQGSPASPASSTIDARSWETLCSLAQRILVPASDLSRAGAGSAHGDND